MKKIFIILAYAAATAGTAVASVADTPTPSTTEDIIMPRRMQRNTFDGFKGKGSVGNDEKATIEVNAEFEGTYTSKGKKYAIKGGSYQSNSSMLTLKVYSSSKKKKKYLGQFEGKISRAGLMTITYSGTFTQKKGKKKTSFNLTDEGR